MAALIAKDIEKQIMLAGFQISHSDGLKAHHIITAFYMSSSTESMLLSLLSAPSFRTLGHLHGRCIKKNII